MRLLRAGCWRRFGHVAVLAAGVAGLVIGTGLAAAAADRPEPGIPYLQCPDTYPDTFPVGDPDVFVSGVCTPGSSDPFQLDAINFALWVNAPQLGLTGSTVARQWARIPSAMMAINALYFYWSPNVSPPNGTTFAFSYVVRAFFVSPNGSSNDYGDSVEIPVRTVAFGSIPTEITLQVSQPRDASNLPVPMQAVTSDRSINVENRQDLSGIFEVDPTRLASPLTVRVRKVVVDGVDLNLTGGCQTGQPAQLSVDSGPKIRVEVPSDTNEYFTRKQFDPTTGYYGIFGGTLRGQIDIPAFSGCRTTSGDDISALLTSAISAPDNPVALRVGFMNCNVFIPQPDGSTRQVPPPPGVTNPNDPRAGCVPSTHENPKVVTFPKPFEFPDYPPGRPR